MVEYIVNSKAEITDKTCEMAERKAPYTLHYAQHTDKDNTAELIIICVSKP